jgi:prophage antirepressor-like protein
MNLTRFQFDSQDIRFVDGNPVAIDVAKALGYATPKTAIKDLIDPDYLTLHQMPTIRYGENKPRIEKVLIITKEAGIYQLIFKSRLETAKQFQKWVFEEILPSIRQTGSYSVEQPKKAITVYSDRIMDLEKNLVKQPNTWCIAEKANYLMLRVEKLGYPIDLLDGSVGIHWSSYRSSKEWAVESSTAIYHLDNHRGTRVIKAYDFCELGYFAQCLETIYVPLKMPVYLDKKYGALAKA